MDFEEFFDEGQDGEGGEGGFPGQNNDMVMFGMNEEEVQQMKQNKDSVIFLVDSHMSMLHKNPHNGPGSPSNLDQVLQAALSFMKTKIITNENDKIAIVLYGCLQT